jgi:hypothetical protein
MFFFLCVRRAFQINLALYKHQEFQTSGTRAMHCEIITKEKWAPSLDTGSPSSLFLCNNPNEVVLIEEIVYFWWHFLHLSFDLIKKIVFSVEFSILSLIILIRVYINFRRLVELTYTCRTGYSYSLSCLTGRGLS